MIERMRTKRGKVEVGIALHRICIFRRQATRFRDCQLEGRKGTTSGQVIKQHIGGNLINNIHGICARAPKGGQGESPFQATVALLLVLIRAVAVRGGQFQESGGGGGREGGGETRGDAVDARG